MKKITYAFFITFMITLITSCGNQPPKYLTNGPFYLKGLKEVERGKIVEAEASFLKDLSLKKSYASHLQLMFLYETQKKYPEVIVQCDQYLKKASKTDFNLKLVKAVKTEALESLHMQLNAKFGSSSVKTVDLNQKAETFFKKKWYAARVRERDLQVKLGNLESKTKLENLISQDSKKQISKKTKKKAKKKIQPKPVATHVKTYVVVKGDSLSVISTKVFGTSKRWREIQSANLPALDNPNKLRLGQIIKIPQPVIRKKKTTVKPTKKVKVQPKKSSKKKKATPALKNKNAKTTEIDKKSQTSEPLGSHNKIMPRGRN